MDIVGRNNVTVFGEGTQPLMFAHGFGCDQNMWRLVTPAFEHDYRIVLFDYVGAGKSDIEAYNPERYDDLNGYAEDILDICRALALSDVVLVGHSVSSVIGALAAIMEPQRFDRLVMIGPSPRYVNDHGYVGGFEREDLQSLLDTMEKNYIGWANFLAPVVMKNEDRPELTEELAESFCSTDPIIARQFARVTFFSDNRKDLPNLRVPSLILQCSDDALAPVEVGRFVNSRTPGSTFRLLEATGHCPHMSHPDETIRHIKEYLSGA